MQALFQIFDGRVNVVVLEGAGREFARFLCALNDGGRYAALIGPSIVIGIWGSGKRVRVGWLDGRLWFVEWAAGRCRKVVTILKRVWRRIVGVVWKVGEIGAKRIFSFFYIANNKQELKKLFLISFTVNFLI